MKYRLSPSVRQFFLSALTALAVGAFLHADDDEKTPVPSKKEQAGAHALILEIFKEDLANAREPSAKSKLAANFLQQGKESKDEPANRYMLYRMARDLAAQAGDAPLALTAVEELTRSFTVPVLEMRTETLALVAEHIDSQEAGKALVDLIMPQITEAVDADDYEAALKLGRVALGAAEKSKSLPLLSSVQKRNLEVQAVQQGFDHLRPFVDRLKKNPADAEANLELGKYFALLKGKWERALPLLAKGTDEALKVQAAKDLARPSESRDQLAVADGWWNLASHEKEPARLHLQIRARFWYEKAVLGLAGLNRTKALRRAEQVTARLEGTVVAGAAGPIGELREFKGHTDEIKGVAISNDGLYAASGGLDQTVRIWNLAVGKEEQVLRGHTKQVWGVAFHPSSRQVVSASWDTTARLWDIKTGQELKRYTHPVDVNGVAISRDGGKLITGCDNYHAYLWNLSTAEELRRYNGFTGYCYAVAFSPDGRLVACGSVDKSLRIFDLADGQLVRSMDSQADAVLAIAFAPDSRSLFSCGDGFAHQWEVATGRELRRFEGHSGRVLGLALSVDGRRLITGGDDKTVRLWDAATGKQLHTFKGHTEAINSVAISSDGRRAVSGGMDRSVRLWGLPAH
jgi:WD40 repeat protein